MADARKQDEIKMIKNPLLSQQNLLFEEIASNPLLVPASPVKKPDDERKMETPSVGGKAEASPVSDIKDARSKAASLSPQQFSEIPLGVSPQNHPPSFLDSTLSFSPQLVPPVSASTPSGQVTPSRIASSSPISKLSSNPLSFLTSFFPTNSSINSSPEPNNQSADSKNEESASSSQQQPTNHRPPPETLTPQLIPVPSPEPPMAKVPHASSANPSPAPTFYNPSNFHLHQSPSFSSPSLSGLVASTDPPPVSSSSSVIQTSLSTSSSVPNFNYFSVSQSESKPQVSASTNSQIANSKDSQNATLPPGSTPPHTTTFSPIRQIPPVPMSHEFPYRSLPSVPPTITSSSEYRPDVTQTTPPYVAPTPEEPNVNIQTYAPVPLLPVSSYFSQPVIGTTSGFPLYSQMSRENLPSNQLTGPPLSSALQPSAPPLPGVDNQTNLVKNDDPALKNPTVSVVPHSLLKQSSPKADSQTAFMAPSGPPPTSTIPFNLRLFKPSSSPNPIPSSVSSNLNQSNFLKQEPSTFNQTSSELSQTDPQSVLQQPPVEADSKTALYSLSGPPPLTTTNQRIFHSSALPNPSVLPSSAQPRDSNSNDHFPSKGSSESSLLDPHSFLQQLTNENDSETVIISPNGPPPSAGVPFNLRLFNPSNSPPANVSLPNPPPASSNLYQPNILNQDSSLLNQTPSEISQTNPQSVLKQSSSENDSKTTTLSPNGPPPSTTVQSQRLSEPSSLPNLSLDSSNVNQPNPNPCALSQTGLQSGENKSSSVTFAPNGPPSPAVPFNLNLFNPSDQSNSSNKYELSVLNPTPSELPQADTQPSSDIDSKTAFFASNGPPPSTNVSYNQRLFKTTNTAMPDPPTVPNSNAAPTFFSHPQTSCLPPFFEPPANSLLETSSPHVIQHSVLTQAPNETALISPNGPPPPSTSVSYNQRLFKPSVLTVTNAALPELPTVSSSNIVPTFSNFSQPQTSCLPPSLGPPASSSPLLQTSSSLVDPHAVLKQPPNEAALVSPNGPPPPSTSVSYNQRLFKPSVLTAINAALPDPPTVSSSNIVPTFSNFSQPQTSCLPPSLRPPASSSPLLQASPSVADPHAVLKPPPNEAAFISPNGPPPSTNLSYNQRLFKPSVLPATTAAIPDPPSVSSSDIVPTFFSQPQTSCLPPSLGQPAGSSFKTELPPSSYFKPIQSSPPSSIPEISSPCPSSSQLLTGQAPTKSVILPPPTAACAKIPAPSLNPREHNPSSSSVQSESGVSSLDVEELDQIQLEGSAVPLFNPQTVGKKTTAELTGSANTYRLSGGLKKRTYAPVPDLGVTERRHYPGTTSGSPPRANSPLAPQTMASQQSNHKSSPPPPDTPTALETYYSAMAEVHTYRPPYHHWFFKSGRSPKSPWTPFSMADSLNLEQVFTSGDVTRETKVATDGGRYDIEILNRKKFSVYWEEPPGEVRRCSWFVRSTSDSRYIPYDENIAALLEDEYKQGCHTNEWNRRIELADGEVIVLHSPTAVAHHVRSVSPDVWGTQPTLQQKPRIVKRGVEDFDIPKGEPNQVDHLLLVVHGIGKACDLRFRSLVEVVDDFRGVSMQLVQSHFQSGLQNGNVGRVEVLPVEWHRALHNEAIDDRLKAITLPSIPRAREFTNETLLDILFYTSPVFCEKIVQAVGAELNRMYKLYLSRNPGFRGQVSLGGHSLGSLILFDMLCHQRPIKHGHLSTQASLAEEEEDAGEVSCLTRKAKLSRRMSYLTMGPGTGQPYTIYPQLNFQPKAFFALGSPIGMFITVRGVESLGEDFKFPTCPAFFNIFHPNDPVAYRVEALINPEMAEFPAVLIPHHKGRKRMHLELKETMQHVTAALKQKLVHSMKNTWNAVYQLAMFNRSNHGIQNEVDKVIEDEVMRDDELERDPPLGVVGEMDSGMEMKVGKLNGGRRIDYVLQEAPLETFNQYISAIRSHCVYWESEDTMLMILKEIYGSMGIRPDSQVPQPILPFDISGDTDNYQHSSEYTYSIGVTPTQFVRKLTSLKYNPVVLTLLGDTAPRIRSKTN